MKSVYSLALKSLLRDLKTYIFLAIMFLAEGFFLTYINFNNGYSAIEYSLEFIEIALLLALPLITAEIFAADRESGFENTLFSLGLKEKEIFVGKAMAVVTVFSVPYLFLLITPFVFEIFGTVNLAAAFASLFAYLLVGISLISVCLFVSITAKRKIHSYIASYACLLLIYLFSLFASLIPITRAFSLLILTAIAIVTAIFVYIFAKSLAVFGGFFCTVEAFLILFYFTTPKAFARSASLFFDTLSPCSSLNAVIYGPFDITAIIHLVLFTAVFVTISFMQLHRRRYE